MQIEVPFTKEEQKTESYLRAAGYLVNIIEPVIKNPGFDSTGSKINSWYQTLEKFSNACEQIYSDDSAIDRIAKYAAMASADKRFEELLVAAGKILRDQVRIQWVESPRNIGRILDKKE